MKGAPKVAVVGRQNVGKSTLVNRLHGRREAIADERPGVTRDRVEVEASWRGRTFLLVDTGGYLAGARGIERLVGEQADRAAEEADLILLVTDAATGVTEEDATLASRLHKAPAPVLVVVNKTDSERDEAEAFSFHALGLGEPIAVSALHGRGSGDLLDAIVALLPETSSRGVIEGEDRFAIVGRPNVGKSSLFNRFVGTMRSVVFEEAGTTRDAVDAIVTWNGRRLRFVDTAGFRRPTRAQGVEYYGFLRAVRAIERAEVALLVIDATAGLTAEDKRIAARVMEAGRGLVIAANKWDLIQEKDTAFKQLGRLGAPFAGAPVLRTSAVKGTGVSKVQPELLRLAEAWTRRASTAEVNRVLEQAQAERPPPAPARRFKYATQAQTGPPVFVLFGGGKPPPTYQRFLERRLREAFSLHGVPIRLRFRTERSGRRSARET
ncbi:MAG: ribosome biogenesis GTPase Der [Actinomycetota bacterium]